MPEKKRHEQPRAGTAAGRALTPTMAAIVALAGFAVAIFAGLGAGVSPDAVLARALLAMVICYPLGLAIGAVSERVITEHATTKDGNRLPGGDTSAVDDERAPA